MIANMKISRKLAAMGLTFFAPIITLTYLFISQVEKDIQFAEKEVLGNTYFSALSEEMNAIIDLSQSHQSKPAAERAAGKDMQEFMPLAVLGPRTPLAAE